MSDVRTALRARHYSRRTEQAYCLWVRRFIRFHGLRHPADMGEPEINAFLTPLATDGQVSASTQTQALSALLFKYRNVVHRDVGTLDGFVRARKPRRLPVVLTRDEVKASSTSSTATSGCSRRFCTAQACASRSAFACACRTSTSPDSSSRCTTARAARTG